MRPLLIAAIGALFLLSSGYDPGPGARLFSASFALPAGAGNMEGGGVLFASPLPPAGVRQVDTYPGADAGEKISACLADLPSTGGICDARGLEGTQSVTSELRVGAANKPAVLLLGVVNLSSSATITVGAFSKIEGVGPATMISSSAPGSAIHVVGEWAALKEFRLVRQGDFGASVGVDVADAVGVGHHVLVRHLQVKGFNIGVRVQRTFYGTFDDVDSVGNATYNWLITNNCVSNDYFNVCSRGGDGAVKTTRIGVRIDTETANVSSQRFHGGTFEGARVQQIDILGGDNTLLEGMHIEVLAPVPVDGTTLLPSGSTLLRGSGTHFLSQLQEGQYVKLDADNISSWARIENIQSDTSATLSDAYQGTAQRGAASYVAGEIRIANFGTNEALNNLVLNPELSVANGSTCGIYIQAARETTILMAGEARRLTLLGAKSQRTRVSSTLYSAPVVDLGSGNQVEAMKPH